MQVYNKVNSIRKDKDHFLLSFFYLWQDFSSVTLFFSKFSELWLKDYVSLGGGSEGHKWRKNSFGTTIAELSAWTNISVDDYTDKGVIYTLDKLKETVTFSKFTKLDKILLLLRSTEELSFKLLSRWRKIRLPNSVDQVSFKILLKYNILSLIESLQCLLYS